MLERLRHPDETTRWWMGFTLVSLVIAVPLLVSGPGNDLDVGNVFRSGRAIARHLTYVPSRPPGAPVHEAIVGILDLLGGPVLTNLASLAAAGVLVWALDSLLRREGVGPAGRWGVALVAANPWFIIAATSTADYVFALMFCVLAALAIRSDHAVLAGLLAAASMGSRIGSMTLILALLIAELGTGRGARRRVVTTALVGAGATAILFIPSMIEAGGLAFAQNDFSASSPFVQLGRAAAKDLLLLGIPTVLVLVVTLPAAIAAIRSWSSSWLVRFAIPGLVLSQVLFIRFPWKMAHLLPTLLCVAILYTVALQERPRVLMAMVALQLVFGVVRIDVLAPNDANEASGGTFSPGVIAGPVLTDWRCRRDDPDAYLGRQKEEIEQAWDCAAPYRD
ncbi:hypothetical protein ACE2AJ_07060 [Aquihabitans daechungensis]|uniref:hypothetical protein n=1 Tax=Aquihabitans daechungensis TaxID=1052257 RepID=UPI003BA09294